MLIHMGSTVLVKREVPQITTVSASSSGLRGYQHHGVDLVPPKEMVVEGTPGLTPILLASKLLDVLPRA